MQQALERLAAAFPEFMSLVEIGRSRAGRPILVARVCEQKEEVLARPVLFVGDAFLCGTPSEGEALLYALYSWLQNHGRDAAVASLLARHPVHFAPCLDPDARGALFGEAPEASLGPDDAEYQRNFPLDWLPTGFEARRPGARSGPYPLSRPEPEALVRYLLESDSFAVCALYDPRARRVANGDPQGRAVAGGPAWPIEEGFPPAPAWLARLRAARQLADLALAVAQQLEPSAGHPLAFFEQVPRLHTPAMADVRERASLVEPDPLNVQTAQFLLALAQELPALALGELRLERLAADLWQVEIELSNEGGLASCAGSEAEPGPVAPLSLSVEGARLEGLAERAGAGGPYLGVAHRRGRYELGQIAGGERRWLRLWLTAENGANVTIACGSARAGRALASVALGTSQR
jgi:hypothetical protein